MTAFSLWIVNPDASLASRWEAVLRREAWTVARASELQGFLAAAPANAVGLALLDWAALGSAPLPAVRALRERLPGVSLILTSHADISNDRIIETFEAGVDDYFPHGIDGGLMRAKLRAHLRRLLPLFAAALDVLKAPDIKLDRGKCELWLRERGRWTANTSLTRTEMQLLALFLERPGAAVERRFIVDTLWQADGESIRPGTVDKHVESLRKKLGRLGGRIQTVYGVGYAFREEA